MSQWKKVAECIRYHRGIKRYEVCVRMDGQRLAGYFDHLQDAKDQRNEWSGMHGRTVRRSVEARNPDNKPEIVRNNTLLRMQWTSTNTGNLQQSA